MDRAMYDHSRGATTTCRPVSLVSCSSPPSYSLPEQEVQEGHARVCWIGTNQEEDIKVEDVEVVDRGACTISNPKRPVPSRLPPSSPPPPAAFLHGDIVARTSDRLGQVRDTGTRSSRDRRRDCTLRPDVVPSVCVWQTGCIIHMELTVDLVDQGGEKLLNVPCQRLQHIRKFRPGQYVIRGNWLGRVVEVTLPPPPLVCPPPSA